MFDSIKRYWRQSIPGGVAAVSWATWGWEHYLTGQGNSVMASIGFFIALFSTGWFLGLIWADQTKPGSYIRKRLTKRKVIEPTLKLQRDVKMSDYFQPVTGLLHEQTHIDTICVLVGIRSHPHKDFANVIAEYLIEVGDETLNHGRIFEGDLNRAVPESTIPLFLVLNRHLDEVRYSLGDAAPINDLPIIPRGQRLTIMVTVSAKGMSPVSRNFTIDVRKDTFGRLLVGSSDGKEFSLSF